MENKDVGMSVKERLDDGPESEDGNEVGRNFNTAGDIEMDAGKYAGEIGESEVGVYLHN